LAFAPAAVRAEVTRVEISSRQDVLNGKAFGAVGAYEKLAGKVYFTVIRTTRTTKSSRTSTRHPGTAKAKWNFQPTCSFSGQRIPRAATASRFSMW